MQNPQIINHSELNPEWNWLAERFSTDNFSWSHVSTRDEHLLDKVPFIGAYPKRAYTGFRAVQKAARNPNSIIVSHGPRPTYFAAKLHRRHADEAFKHIAYSFNFTELPVGLKRMEMTRAFKNVDKFVVFSLMEKSLYENYFDIDPLKIDFLHWAVKTPKVHNPEPGLRTRSYVCAVGSQGRDYGTLIKAAKRLPDISFRLVAHPYNLIDLDIPANVHVHTSVTNEMAMDIIANSRFLILPLSNAKLPCGHVTAVAAMHLGKMVIATDSTGLHDYLINGETAVLVPPKDPISLAGAIEDAWLDTDRIERIAKAGQAFATHWCHEDRVVNYFRNLLITYEN